jgi:hypothetical protein
MTFLGTTALALGLLAGAPEPAPVQPRPQTRVEAPRTSEKDLTGRMLLSIPFHGARFWIEGDVDKKIPFHIWLPLGNFIQIEILDFRAPTPSPSDYFLIY